MADGRQVSPAGEPARHLFARTGGGGPIARRLAGRRARVIKDRTLKATFGRSADAAVNGLSTYFVWLQSRQRKASSPTSKPDDAALLHRLAKTDVFIRIAPGAAERPASLSKDLRENIAPDHRRYFRLKLGQFIHGDEGIRPARAGRGGLAEITSHPPVPAASACRSRHRLRHGGPCGDPQPLIARSVTGRSARLGRPVRRHGRLDERAAASTFEGTGRSRSAIDLAHPSICPTAFGRRRQSPC